MYIVRKIEFAEIRKLQMAHPDFATSGWAVVERDGEREIVVDWYADKKCAEEDAAEQNAHN